MKERRTLARSMAVLRREMLREAPSSVCRRRFTLSACHGSQHDSRKFACCHLLDRAFVVKLWCVEYNVINVVLSQVGAHVLIDSRRCAIAPQLHPVNLNPKIRRLRPAAHLDADVIDVVCLIEHDDTFLLQLTRHHLRHLRRVRT